MKNKMNKSIRVVLPVVMLFLLSCATTPKMQTPPREELRTNLGRIGVVSGSFQPEVRLQTPMTKGLLHGSVQENGLELWLREEAAVMMQGV